MASTWHTAPLVGSKPSDAPSRRADGRSLPIRLDLGRLGIHLAVLLLMVALVRGLTFDQLALPNVAAMLRMAPSPEDNIPIEAQALPDTETRYLESASVPVTSRIIHSSLPIGEPQHAVRTSITLYAVEPGDSVLGIAQKFGLEGNSLLWANGRLADNPDFLKVGQELVILPVDGAYHTVTKGETLEEIAEAYKVAPEAITEYAGNDLSAPYDLVGGQKLIIPGGVRPYVPRRVVAYTGPVPANAQKGTGSFVWPTSGFISQGYWEGHHAIDIAGSPGTPILAADSGYVAVAQWSDVGYGRMVIIDHGNGFQTLYAHMTKYYVEPGQSVGKGQQIGERGSTGNSTGPHLHFEVIKNGARHNPFIYLP